MLRAEPQTSYNGKGKSIFQSVLLQVKKNPGGPDLFPDNSAISGVLMTIAAVGSPGSPHTIFVPAVEGCHGIPLLSKGRSDFES